MNIKEHYVKRKKNRNALFLPASLSVMSLLIAAESPSTSIPPV